ncbi:hypothetical protein [Oryzomicrobium sp.]|uniref:hypothetical protein n=1 Tax=Oryzomicrobium sp. TaxID=1911578 RepID=UPI002FE3327B
MKLRASLLAVAVPSVLLLAGCASAPTGPSVMALPGGGKSFDQFRADDMDCRQYAQYQIGGSSANQSSIESGVGSAAIGTAVGAAAGALIGGHSGAGVGAGAGLLVGSAAGTGAAQTSANATQRNYDNAYVQCMYAKGNQIPVATSQVRSRHMAPPPSSGGYYPPPPPGSPPPPPPSAPGY